MGYQSKTYSLSDEVVAAIEAARANGETPNQLLRRVLLGAGDASEFGPPTNGPAQLDAVGPELSSGRGKASIETRQMRQKGDTKR